MVEQTNLTFDQEMHVESHAPYLKVFFALLILTILEYTYASTGLLGFFILVLGLMILAIIKASLVGWYFMHLKFEGRWVYGMLIPASILAMILTFALVPDLAMQPVTDVNPDIEEVSAAPATPVAVRL
jgi:cytochrome c oxidase subunit 4